MTLGTEHRRLLRAFVVVLAVAAALLASGCMWGFVTDADSGAGVAGATVKVTDSYGATYTTTTNGLYGFDSANGPVPALGPVSVEVSAPGYNTLTVPRLVQYDDNPNASLADLRSFQEVQSFALVPVTTPSLSADLAVTDLYPDKQPNGTLWANITNNGPDSLTNSRIYLTCQVQKTDKATCGKWSVPVVIPLDVYLSPGQTQSFDTAIGLDTATYWYDALCVVQVTFTDPDSTNDSYSEVIPPPTGDLELQDVLLKTTNEIGFRLTSSGSLPATFWYSVNQQYPNGGGLGFGTSVGLAAGSNAYWTGQSVTDTPSVTVSIDPNQCIPETDETNNELTMTCSAASHSCW